MKFSNWLKEKLDEYLEFGARFNHARASFYINLTMLIPLTIIFFIVVFILSSWDSRILWIKNKMSPNKITVERIGLGQKENITIKWACESYCQPIIIYTQHKVCYKNFKNSGDNIFLVYLNDSLIDREKQYKHKYWQGFNYNFKIIKKENKYKSELKIE